MRKISAEPGFNPVENRERYLFAHLLVVNLTAKKYSQKDLKIFFLICEIYFFVSEAAQENPLKHLEKIFSFFLFLVLSFLSSFLIYPFLLQYWVQAFYCFHLETENCTIRKKVPEKRNPVTWHIHYLHQENRTRRTKKERKKKKKWFFCNFGSNIFYCCHFCSKKIPFYLFTNKGTFSTAIHFRMMLIFCYLLSKRTSMKVTKIY